MRRRLVFTDDESNTDMPQSMIKTLKRYDMFPKLKRSATIQTRVGAALSSISFTIMIILFFSEITAYLKQITTEHLVVDRLIGQKISINFNITFYSLPCSAASIDSMDITGDQQVNVIQKILKQHINENGKPIGEPSNGFFSDISDPLKMLRPQLEDTRGCILSGSLLVNKVAGNFHIALGQSHSQGVRHIHHFVMSDIAKYNISHKINHLSFGEKFPGIKYPLNGIIKILTNPFGGLYQYYIKIVPTIYKKSNGQILKTNQFSVTDQFIKIDSPKFGQFYIPQLPGIFFVYDFSQFMVEIVDKNQSFSTFLINISAIIGGIFAVTSMIDSVIHHLKNLKIYSNAGRNKEFIRPFSNA